MDEKKLRRYLGRLGDEAVPAPGFDELSLQVAEVGQQTARSRRGLVLAVAAALVVLGGVGLLARGGNGSATTVDAVGSFSSVGIDTTTTVEPMVLLPNIGVPLCEIDELVMLPNGDDSAPFMYSTASPEGPSVQITAVFRNESSTPCVRPQTQSIKITNAAGNAHYGSSRSDDCDQSSPYCLIEPGETYAFGYIFGPSSTLVGSLTSLTPGTYRALVTLISRLEVEAGSDPVDLSMFDGVYERRTYLGDLTFEIPSEENRDPEVALDDGTRILCELDELVMLPNASAKVDTSSGVVTLLAEFWNFSNSPCARIGQASFEVFDSDGKYVDGVFAIWTFGEDSPISILPGESHTFGQEWSLIKTNTVNGYTSRVAQGRYRIVVSLTASLAVDKDGQALPIGEIGGTNRKRTYSGEIFVEVPNDIPSWPPTDEEIWEYGIQRDRLFMILERHGFDTSTGDHPGLLSDSKDLVDSGNGKYLQVSTLWRFDEPPGDFELLGPIQIGGVILDGISRGAARQGIWFRCAGLYVEFTGSPNLDAYVDPVEAAHSEFCGPWAN